MDSILERWSDCCYDLLRWAVNCWIFLIIPSEQTKTYRKNIKAIDITLKYSLIRVLQDNMLEIGMDATFIYNIK